MEPTGAREMIISFKKRLIFLSVVILLLLNHSYAFCQNNSDKIIIQDSIIKKVRDAYVDTISSSTLLDGAIEGLIGKLDPHSSYMPPTAAGEFKEKIRGDFDGIGITFAMIDGKITIIEVVEGGPSEGLGLKARDKIIKIGKDSAVGISQEEVKNRLRGPKDSTVTVVVERSGEEKLLTFKIKRDKININSVSHAYMVDERTGYIALSRFTEKSHTEVKIALQKLQAQGMRRLVFDLRNNSGGLLEVSVNIVRFFINQGLIVETRGSRSSDNKQYRANGRAQFADLPMIVLINHGSASASEIVAGALQDHDRALIVGQTSFGKGLVMNEFPLTADTGDRRRKYLGSLILSVAHYYTPSGRLIQRPFDKGKENYIREGFDNIDPNAADSSKAENPVYYTDLRRKVYGGGGITPDKEVALLLKLNKLERAIRKTNLCFEFADVYLMLHEDIPEKFEEFLTNYRIPQEEMMRFKEFIVENGITIEAEPSFNEELEELVAKHDLSEESVEIIKKSLTETNIEYNKTLFDKSIDFIERELKQEIARMVWGPVERFIVWHTNDTELMEALSYFDEAEVLLKRRIAMGKVNQETSQLE
ncbi:S41 family peptidase [Candidatus Latescibacterota bacterium]